MHEVFSSEPAETSRSVILYSLTNFFGVQAFTLAEERS
jgi:hypothetical protein